VLSSASEMGYQRQRGLSQSLTGFRPRSVVE
jgi:hypothetical protein